MKTFATILITSFLIIFLSAPMNVAINTRWGVPLFVFLMTIVGVVMIVVATRAWPAECEALPGTEEKDADRAKLINS